MRYCKWSSQSGLCCWQYWTEVESSIECVTCTIPIRGVKHYMRDMDINSWSQAFYARHGRYQVMITVGVVDRKLDSWIVVAQIDSQAVGANFDNCEASRSKLLHGCLGSMPLWHVKAEVVFPCRYLRRGSILASCRGWRWSTSFSSCF